MKFLKMCGKVLRSLDTNFSEVLSIVTPDGFIMKMDGANDTIENQILKIIKDAQGNYKVLVEETKETIGRSIDELLVNVKIPLNEKGFNKWFDELTLEEFDRLWADDKIRRTLGLLSIMNGVWFVNLDNLKNGVCQWMKYTDLEQRL